MLWGAIALGCVVVGLGWLNTFAQIARVQAPELREKFDEQVERAAAEAGELSETAQEKTSTFTEAINLIKKGYEEEKIRIEEELLTSQTDQP